MDLTFSPKVAICSPTNFNNDEFVSNVNSALADLDFLTDEPPPPIPSELMYEPPIFKIKKMASKIGNILEKTKSEKSLKDGEILSSFINSDFDFSTDYQIKSHEIEQLRTVFDFISKNRKNVHYASPIYPANDILVIVSVMTPKSTNYELKRQVHQCLIALGSNTLSQLFKKIVCPICKIAEVTAGPHCVPDQIEVDGKVHYNFNKGFDKPLSQVLTKINCCGNFKSKGGCTHLIVFNGAFAVHVEDSAHANFTEAIISSPPQPANNEKDEGEENNNDNDTIQSEKEPKYPSIQIDDDPQDNLSFPVEFAGKGASPPPCYGCKVRPGFIVIKDDSFITTSGSSSIKIEDTEIDEEEDFIEKFPFRFFCSKCFDEAVYDKEKAIVINLSEHFFLPVS